MTHERHQSRTSRGIRQMSPPDKSTFSKVQKIFITESHLNHSEDNSIHNFHSTSFKYQRMKLSILYTLAAIANTEEKKGT